MHFPVCMYISIKSKKRNKNKKQASASLSELIQRERREAAKYLLCALQF